MILSQSVLVNRQLEATDHERQPWIIRKQTQRSSLVRLTAWIL